MHPVRCRSRWYQRIALTVFPLTGITLDHLVASFKTGESHICDSVLLVMCFLRGDNWCKCRKGEMNTREAVSNSASLFEYKVNQITHGTRLVWNSFRSTFREPSKRRDAVIEDTTCAIRRFRLVKLGDEMPRLFLQIS